jgi:hypothetical protein
MPAPINTGLPVNVVQSLSINYASATAASAGQLVDFTGNLVTVATTVPFGVLREDAVQNRIVSVATVGMVEMIAGAAVAIGAAITADATGRGITAVAGNQIFARAMSATTAAGQRFQALITREGTT